MLIKHIARVNKIETVFVKESKYMLNLFVLDDKEIFHSLNLIIDGTTETVADKISGKVPVSANKIVIMKTIYSPYLTFPNMIVFIDDKGIVYFSTGDVNTITRELIGDTSKKAIIPMIVDINMDYTSGYAYIVHAYDNKGVVYDKKYNDKKFVMQKYSLKIKKIKKEFILTTDYKLYYKPIKQSRPDKINVECDVIDFDLVGDKVYLICKDEKLLIFSSSQVFINKLIKDTVDLKDLISKREIEIADLKQKQIGGGDRYYYKYMKYRDKYNRLKKLKE